jgi:hypothetical protein
MGVLAAESREIAERLQVGLLHRVLRVGLLPKEIPRQGERRAQMGQHLQLEAVDRSRLPRVAGAST